MPLGSGSVEPAAQCDADQLRRLMKRKKPTPEELRALLERSDATQRLLQEHIDRIAAELEAKKKPA